MYKFQDKTITMKGAYTPNSKISTGIQLLNEKVYPNSQGLAVEPVTLRGTTTT